MKRRLMLPCDCVGTCTVLVVSEWESSDELPEETYFELYEHIRAQGRWRDRLRVAWAVLRGREPYTHGTAFIDTDKLVQLRDFLTDCLSDVARTAPREQQNTGGDA